MYTFHEYRCLLSRLRENGFKFQLEPTTVFKNIIIKHDVEDKIDLALKSAILENELGIQSIYYVHGFFLDSDYSIDILKKISQLGHVIGYHYDVLDQNDGDYNKALEDFKIDLIRFSNIGLDIKTVCPHGNPVKVRKGWNSNKDFFKNIEIRANFPEIHDIVNDFEKYYANYSYLSDAGFRLNIIGDIVNNDKSHAKPDTVISDSELLSIKSSVVLSIHTHRMRESKSELYVRKYLFFLLRWLVRFLTKNSLIKKTLSPFFYLAKKL